PELSVTGSGPLDSWEGDFLLTAVPRPPEPGSGDVAPGTPPAPARPSPAPDAADPRDGRRALPLAPASLAEHGVPAGTPASPAGTEAFPAGTDALPAGTDASPADSRGPAPADGGAKRSEIRGRLLFKGAGGKTLEELARAPDAPFSLRLEAGKDPDFPIPGDATRFLGKTLRLEASFDKDGAELAGEARLYSEKGSLELKPVNVSILKDGLAAEGRGALEIMDFGEFARVGGGAEAPDGAAASPAGAGEPTPPAKPASAPGVPPLPPKAVGTWGAGGTGTGAAAGTGADAGTNPPALGGAGPDGAGGAGGGPSGGSEMLPPPAVKADLLYSLEFKGRDANLKSLSAEGDGLDLKLSGSFRQGGGPEAREAGGGEASASLALSLAPGSGFARLLNAMAPGITPGAGIELGVSGGFLVAEKSLKDVSVTAETGDLSAFAPRLGGDAKLSAKASGPIAGELAASLELSSGRLLFQSGPGDPEPAELLGAVVRAGGAVNGLADGPSFDGKLEMSAKGRLPGEEAVRDAAMNGKVSFSSKGGGMAFSAEGLGLSALGAELKAPRLDASFSGDGPPELSGSLELEVASWELPSKLAGVGISGQPLRLEISLDGASDPPRYEASLENASLAIEGVARLAGTELKAVATGPLASPALDVRLKEGPGQAAGFSWQQGELAARSSAPGGPVEVSLAFKEKGGKDLASLSGVYRAPGALMRLDALKFLYPGAKEPLVLRRPATITAPPANESFASPKLAVDRLELSLGKTSVALAGSLRPPELSVEIREAPFSLAKDFGGPELPEGALTELNARLGPGGAARFDLKAFMLMEGETDRKLRFSAEANGALEGGRTLAGDVNVALPARP
ncbi:MAG: hypothetical protein LBQ12_01595, partial [Deltaproteobacteria bacterium]|nr:hypothetical protein [Deltaproteobacteria bacterium]